MNTGYLGWTAHLSRDSVKVEDLVGNGKGAWECGALNREKVKGLKG
jgi:hypothetical protein